MKTLELVQPADFFRGRVSDAAFSLGLNLEEDLEFYLVNLLCEFINPASLEIDHGMGILDTPLAFMLKKALESTPDTQIKVYKRLGDTSLYFAGYFQDYFNRKTFDVSYYIEMGSAAYERTSQLMKSHKNDAHFSQIFGNLSHDFRKLVSVLSQISESVPHTGEKQLLSTYAKWQQNQSETLRKILEEEGILPIHTPPQKDPI